MSEETEDKEVIEERPVITKAMSNLEHVVSRAADHINLIAETASEDPSGLDAERIEKIVFFMQAQVDRLAHDLNAILARGGVGARFTFDIELPKTPMPTRQALPSAGLARVRTPPRERAQGARAIGRMVGTKEVVIADEVESYDPPPRPDRDTEIDFLDE